MRLFRPDNYLLWMGVLAFIAVVIYVGSNYVFELSQKSTSSDETAPLHQTQSEIDRETVLPTHSEVDASTQKKVRFEETPTETPTDEQNQASSEQSSSNERPTQPINEIPQYVYFDVAKHDFLKDPFMGRVIIELFTAQYPRTSLNFVQLCKESKYANTPFHRVIKDFMIQGGDIVNQDGSGTYSIYGGEGSTFEDEGFYHNHDQPGLLSMANSGPHTNGSQFFITTAPAPHLDGKHVVFGRVVEGLEYIHDIEREVTDTNDRPIRKCYIMNCGITEKPDTTPTTQWLVDKIATPPVSSSLDQNKHTYEQQQFTEPLPFQI